MTIKDSADRATTLAQEKLEQARTVASDAFDATRDKVGTVYGAAVEKAADVYDTARETASGAYETARDKASAAYDSARARANDAAIKASQSVDDQPVIALIGGLALGALVAAVLPRSQREKDALGGVGAKLNSVAKTALLAARDAGKDRLDELGLSPDKARDTVRQILGDAASVATSASHAAAESVKTEPK